MIANRATAKLMSAFDWRARAVLFRNARVYLRNWRTAFLPPALEPVVFFVALGFGLGGLVGPIAVGDRNVDYASFVAPGLVAYTAFTTPFYEALYSAYVRIFYQKTWMGILVTQMELEHIVWGEILWAAARGAMNAVVVSLTLLALNFAGAIDIRVEWLPVLPLLGFIAGLAYGAVALVFTALVPSIDHMNYPVFLVGWPISLMSNTVFPVPTEHAWVGVLMDLNPLYHLAGVSRSLLLLGNTGGHLGPLLAETLVLLVAATLLVQRLMRKRVLSG